LRSFLGAQDLQDRVEFLVHDLELFVGPAAVGARAELRARAEGPLAACPERSRRIFLEAGAAQDRLAAVRLERDFARRTAFGAGRAEQLGPVEISAAGPALPRLGAAEGLAAFPSAGLL